MKLTKLIAREVLDSRGYPTVAVQATIDDGTCAEAMVPSGASTGVHEALELRDNDPRRYGGKGVLNACRNVEEKIQPEVLGMDVQNISAIDQRMQKLDGTEQKSQLGANAILAVSLAVALAGARAKKMPLWKHLRDVFSFEGITASSDVIMPKPMMNILNGGLHANNGLDIQEFLIVPQQKQFAEAVRCGAEIFHVLKAMLVSGGHSTAVGDEGGFAPAMSSHEAVLRLLHDAIAKAQYTFGSDVFCALDVAASEFFRDGAYHFEGKVRTADELLRMYKKWQKEFHLCSIEDGFAEDDWQSWKMITEQMGSQTMLVGDDLFVTDMKRLQKGIDDGIANAILIKINQIGTLTETVAAMNLARKNGYKVVVSHRSGETEDTTIADLACAFNAEYIKTGSLSRSERVVKYNRLLAIERGE